MSTTGLMAGKRGLIMGVANDRSLAWGIAKACVDAGAEVAFTYQGERLQKNVEDLAGSFGDDTLITPCDVTKDEDIARVFDEVGKKFGKLDLMLHAVAFFQLADPVIPAGASHGFCMDEVAVRAVHGARINDLSPRHRLGKGGSKIPSVTEVSSCFNHITDSPCLLKWILLLMPSCSDSLPRQNSVKYGVYGNIKS